MIAGEAAIQGPEFPGDSTKRSLAVVVTSAHVLVLRFDSLDGQPRWILMAGRSSDVTIERRTEMLGLSPAVIVSGTDAQWEIRGYPGVFAPEPVIEAWQRAASGSG